MSTINRLKLVCPEWITFNHLFDEVYAKQPTRPIIQLMNTGQSVNCRFLPKAANQSKLFITAYLFSRVKPSKKMLQTRWCWWPTPTDVCETLNHSSKEFEVRRIGFLSLGWFFRPSISLCSVRDSFALQLGSVGLAEWQLFLAFQHKRSRPKSSLLRQVGPEGSECHRSGDHGLKRGN